MNEVQNLAEMTSEELFTARQLADADLLDDSVDVNEARARSRAIREEMNVRNRQTIKPAKVTPQVTYQPNESPQAKAQKTAEDARLEQRDHDIRDHLGLSEDDSLVQVHLSENIRYEFADEYEARSWGMVQVGAYIGYTDFKTGQFVAYKPNDKGVTMNEQTELSPQYDVYVFNRLGQRAHVDSFITKDYAEAVAAEQRTHAGYTGAEVVKIEAVDNTQSGLKAGTTNDVWVRDDADADAIMQEIQQTLADIADDQRRACDDDAHKVADTLYDASDLVQRIREYVGGKAAVTSEPTLDDVVAAKPAQAVSEAVSTSDDTTDKIGIESIVIDRAEGLISECGEPYTAEGFEDAELYLARQAETAPKTGGYDKVDFTINFENGETYTGRYDMKHISIERPDLRGHVRDFVRFSAGVNRPPHMTEESWRGYLNAMEQYNPGIQDKFKDLYDNYDVGISG